MADISPASKRVGEEVAWLRTYRPVSEAANNRPPTSELKPTHPPGPAVSPYTAAEIADAQGQLRGTYKLAAHAVQIDTAGTDKALARIAATNGVLMLETATVNPALDANHRDAARALESAYQTVTVKSSYDVATDADFQAALDGVIAKDVVMKKVCGGG